MNSEQILRAITDLDLDNETPANIPFSSGEMIALVRDVIQIEMARQSHLHRPQESERIDSLEKRMEAMRREFMRQRRTPSVIYVRKTQNITTPPPEAFFASGKTAMLTTPTTEARRPTAMVVFYSLGLGLSFLFAVLLALSAVKIDTIHPFISLLGFVGGLGWLTTAWTDLLLWNRDNLGGSRAKETEEHDAALAQG